MVFPTAEQPRNSYHLWHIFAFPTNRGSIPAVAIPSSWRNSVTGLYSSMVGIIFVSIWVFIVAIIRKRHGDRVLIHRVAFHEEARFMKFQAWTHTNKLKRGSSWTVWIVAVFIVWITNMGIGPAIVSQLVLGEGAPANGDELFFPQAWTNIPSYTNTQKRNNALKPSVLRALSITELNIPKAVDRVQLNQRSLGQRADGQQILQFDYSYNLSAQDFGMQHFNSLGFTIQGSCYTEYGWSQGGDKHNAYLLWNNQTFNITLSPQQFAIPRAFFYTGNSSDTTDGELVGGSNQTYAVVVSTAGKYGFAPGTDPWYLTTDEGPASSAFPDLVLDDRPALSCWETNLWTWGDTPLGDTWYFIYTKPNHTIPTIVRDVLYTALWQPGIITTGQSLDTINLAVADQDLEESFDPGAGSIFKDLHRLLVTTFIWNANIFFDTTLYSVNTTYGTQNLILPENRAAIADFVVFTPDATAMSFVFIIVVPGFVALISLLNWFIGRKIGDNYGPCEQENEHKA
jgi:hypothetical protein